MLLVFALMQIYNENEQAQQGKTKNVQFEGRGDPRKWNRGKFYVQGDKEIKEKPDAKWDKGVLMSGQAPTQLSFQLLRRNLRKVNCS